MPAAGIGRFLPPPSWPVRRRWRRSPYPKGAVAAAIATFTLAHLAFLLANGLYNAYLPKLSNDGNVARISGLGWGLSYLGSSVPCCSASPSGPSSFC
jgi:hypothetical protein